MRAAPEQGGIAHLLRRLALVDRLLFVAVGCIAALGLGALHQVRESRAAREQLESLRIRVESIEARQAGAAEREASEARRQAEAEERVRRLWNEGRGFARAETAVLRDWVRRVEQRVDESQRRVDARDRRADAFLRALRDSLEALESRVRSDPDARLEREARVGGRQPGRGTG
jgi:predicted nuclease with TOPRIM domain